MRPRTRGGAGAPKSWSSSKRDIEKVSLYLLEQPLLSIVIPTYNMDKYITRSLDVLAHPCFAKLIEIIAVNDGSKDYTPEILKGQLQRFDNLKVITKKKMVAMDLV